MRILFVLIVLITITPKAHAQDENPFTKIDYDTIIIYDFEPGESESSIITKANKLNHRILKRQVLTVSEGNKLVQILGLTSSYGEYPAMCYDPHFGIVFYKNGIPVQHVTICMDCNVLYSSIDIPAQQQGKQIAEDGAAYYLLDGMSASLVMHLDHLQKKYKFSHRIQMH